MKIRNKNEDKKSKDTQEMVQLRSTAFQRQEKKER